MDGFGRDQDHMCYVTNGTAFPSHVCHTLQSRNIEEGTSWANQHPKPAPQSTDLRTLVYIPC